MIKNSLQKYSTHYNSDFNVCAKRVTFVPETDKSVFEMKKYAQKNLSLEQKNEENVYFCRKNHWW